MAETGDDDLVYNPAVHSRREYFRSVAFRGAVAYNGGVAKDTTAPDGPPHADSNRERDMPEVQDGRERPGPLDAPVPPQPREDESVHPATGGVGGVFRPEVQDALPGDGDRHGDVLNLDVSVTSALGDMAEAERQSIPKLNDFLGKLLTLNTALVGGGMVLAKGEVMPLWASTLVVAALCVSVGFCLNGLKPFKVVLGGQLGGPAEQACAFLNAQEDAINAKEAAMKRAILAFGVALAIGLGGMTVRAAESATPPPPATAR